MTVRQVCLLTENLDSSINFAKSVSLGYIIWASSRQVIYSFDFFLAS